MNENKSKDTMTVALKEVITIPNAQSYLVIPNKHWTTKEHMNLEFNPWSVWTQTGWWTLGDLNPRPSGCKPDALPTELSALVVVAVSLSLLSLHLSTAEESNAVNRCISVGPYANTGTGHANNGLEFRNILLSS